MKNSQIHLGLPNSDLRDFFSISLVKNCVEEFKNKKEIIELKVREWAIKDCENEISFHQRRLQLLKEKFSILTLIKMQGWDEFDVSDETEKDLWSNGYSTYMSFIGTRQEYDNFIKNNNK